MIAIVNKNRWPILLLPGDSREFWYETFSALVEPFDKSCVLLLISGGVNPRVRSDQCSYVCALHVREFTTSPSGFEPSVYLSFSDLVVDCKPQTYGLVLLIKASKTYPFRQGVKLFLQRTGNALGPEASVSRLLLLFTWRRFFVFLPSFSISGFHSNSPST